MKRVIPVLVMVILAGCATKPVDQRLAQLQDQDQPPAYINGYLSGCDSGTIVAGNPWYLFQKNEFLYKSDAKYAKGWNDGFQTCLSQKRASGY
ncbi:MAG TPA: hypothetical protein VN642_01925 [Dongiaceae bacterium]|jgi:hypothetical protein|nr:hypothetical protein [Dongiaceae bacterium]